MWSGFADRGTSNRGPTRPTPPGGGRQRPGACGNGGRWVCVCAAAASGGHPVEPIVVPAAATRGARRVGGRGTSRWRRVATRSRPTPLLRGRGTSTRRGRRAGGLGRPRRAAPHPLSPAPAGGALRTTLWGEPRATRPARRGQDGGRAGGTHQHRRRPPKHWPNDGARPHAARRPHPALAAAATGVCARRLAQPSVSRRRHAGAAGGAARRSPPPRPPPSPPRPR